MRRIIIALSALFLAYPVSTLTAQPQCDSYASAGAALDEGKFDEALESYKACLEAAPDDAKVQFMIGTVYEAKGDFGSAIEHWSRAVRLDPLYREFLKNRFDARLPGVSRGVIHDHFGNKFCFGLFYVTRDKIVYRSLWGFPRLGTDDSFETSISNISRVEVKLKERGRGWISNMPKRTELHFRFKEKIRGVEDNWSRDEMKFFFGVTQLSQLDLREFAGNLLRYLESKDVTLLPKK